jgi:hypothetical protein
MDHANQHLNNLSFSSSIPFRSFSLCKVHVSLRYVQPGVRFCRTLNLLSVQCLMLLQACSRGHIKASILHRNAPFTCVVEFCPKACCNVFMNLIHSGYYIVPPAFNSKIPHVSSTKSIQVFCLFYAVKSDYFPNSINSLVCAVRIRCVFCEIGSENCIILLNFRIFIKPFKVLG